MKASASIGESARKWELRSLSVAVYACSNDANKLSPPFPVTLLKLYHAVYKVLVFLYSAYLFLTHIGLCDHKTHGE